MPSLSFAAHNVSKQNDAANSTELVALNTYNKRTPWANVRVDDYDLDFLILRDRLARETDPRSHTKQLVSAI